MKERGERGEQCEPVNRGIGGERETRGWRTEERGMLGSLGNPHEPLEVHPRYTLIAFPILVVPMHLAPSDLDDRYRLSRLHSAPFQRIDKILGPPRSDVPRTLAMRTRETRGPGVMSPKNRATRAARHSPDSFDCVDSVEALRSVRKTVGQIVIASL